MRRKKVQIALFFTIHVWKKTLVCFLKHPLLWYTHISDTEYTRNYACYLHYCQEKTNTRKNEQMNVRF